jgi:hypothetical protein
VFLQDPFIERRVFKETLLDLPGSPLDEREHQRAGTLGGARQVDHPDQPPGRGIGDGDSRTGQPRQSVSEMLVPLHQRRTTPGDRRADRVRTDLFFPVDILLPGARSGKIAANRTPRPGTRAPEDYEIA